MLPFPNQPKIFTAFKSGFETVSTHLYLILFPIVLDLFLLFGVRITVVNPMQDVIQRFVLPSSATTDVVASWELFKTQLIEFFRYFSLTSFLRSFPVGIPSLFSSVAFERNPLGVNQFINLDQWGSAFLVALGFSLLGLFAAYVLYRLIANVISRQPMQSVPFIDSHSLLAWILIPILTIAFSLVLLFPAVLLVSLIGAIFPAFTSIGYFFLTLGLISLIMPILFTPHLIMVENLPFRQAILASFRTVRLTNAKSSTFLFLAIVVNYLANMLWLIPQDNSWMLLISILGHALISMITLVASFHYILDARKSVFEFDKNQVSDSNLA